MQSVRGRSALTTQSCRAIRMAQGILPATFMVQDIISSM